MAQHTTPATPATPTSKTLPAHGMSRWNQIAPFSPFSREKFRQLVIAGKAPQPILFSKRCTAYQNKELHRFFADPLNYRAEGFEEGTNPCSSQTPPDRVGIKDAGVTHIKKVTGQTAASKNLRPKNTKIGGAE